MFSGKCIFHKSNFEIIITISEKDSKKKIYEFYRDNINYINLPLQYEKDIKSIDNYINKLNKKEKFEFVIDSPVDSDEDDDGDITILICSDTKVYSLNILFGKKITSIINFPINK